LSKRLLLIRPGAIGDCILSLPALEYLATPKTEIWVPSAVIPLIRFAQARSIASTGLDLFGVGDLEPPAQLVASLESFDQIVSWYGTNRPEFRAAIESLGVPCVFLPALPPPGCLCHAVDFFLDSVGAPLGARPHIEAPASDAHPVIVIHPFSGSVRKNWPLTSFETVAAQTPRPAAWTAGPDEPLAHATRFDNLLDLASWLAGAELYLGNDSGITHLAAALGLPTIALFGPASSEIWEPRGARVIVLRHSPLEQLPPSAVVAVLNRQLGSR
jgi:heptosyltransferase III